MTVMTKTHQTNSIRFNYAANQAKRRGDAAKRLAGRVVHPVEVASLPQKMSSRVPAFAMMTGFGLMALLIHGALVSALMATGASSNETRTETEKVVFRVVAPPPVQEAVPEPLMEPEEVEAPPEVVQAAVPAEVDEPVPPPKTTPVKKSRRAPSKGMMAKAESVNREESAPPPSTQKRAVVGITMESTVTGGSGASYAVGNTRLGSTAAVQSAEKIEKLTKGNASGRGGSGTDASAPANRVASFIPTVSSDFTRPQRISEVDLPYPPDLKSKGIEGNVMVLIVIDEEGVVQKVRILKSSGYREFDEAALKAAQKAVYSPALRDGKAVEYNLKYTYRFRIKGA